MTPDRPRKFKLSDFPGMARPLRRALIATLNRGEPSRKLTDEEKRKLVKPPEKLA